MAPRYENLCIVRAERLKMIWKKRFLLATLTVIVLLMFSHSFVVAQCSMCRTALTGSAEGRDLAQGFNRGIMFLASVPFLIAGTLTLLVFQSTRHTAHRVDTKRRYKFFRDRVLRRLRCQMPRHGLQLLSGHPLQVPVARSGPSPLRSRVQSSQLNGRHDLRRGQPVADPNS